MARQQIVFNPNFLSDVKDYFGLTISEEDIQTRITETVAQNPVSSQEQNAGVLDLDTKLETFIDRIEFIRHLDILADNAKKKNFNINGQEVVGVDWDISSLRLYLSLTCIDIFFDANNHKEHFNNVFSNISSSLQSELTENLKVIENSSKSVDKLDFAEFFYNIRNSYTHAGIRFHSDGTSKFTLAQEFVVGTARNKIVKKLLIEKGFDLVDFILKVAVENAKRKFGW